MFSKLSLQLLTISIAVNNSKDSISLPHLTMDERQLFFLNKKKDILRSQYDMVCFDHKCYDNQRQTSSQLFESFMKVNVVLLIAPPQWGKTGTCINLAYNLVTHPNDEINIDPDNVLYITGMNDNDWKSQTQERVPDIWNDNVWHLKDSVKKLPDKLNNFRDGLIIYDECHLACGENQKIDKIFKSNNLYDLDYLKKNNIYILFVSATPDALSHQLSEWNCNKYSKINAVLSDQYISPWKLLDYDKLQQHDFYEEYDTFDNISNFIQNQKKPLYHIIREPTFTKKKSLYKMHLSIMKDDLLDNHNIDIEIKDYNSNNKKIDEQFDFSKPPKKHTIINVIRYFGAAKTIPKENIGILYENQTTKTNNSIIIQSFIGRFCGYYNPNELPFMIYSDIDSVELYKNVFDNKSNYTGMKYNGCRLKSSTNNVKVKNTITEPSKYGIDVEEKVSNKTDILHIEDYKSFEEVKNRVNSFGKKLQKRKCNENGFYENTIRSKKKVFSYDEVITNKGWGINKTYRHRLHPCYKNINNKNSLMWVLIHNY